MTNNMSNEEGGALDDESDAGSGDSPVHQWWIWAMLNMSGEDLIAAIVPDRVGVGEPDY